MNANPTYSSASANPAPNAPRVLIVEDDASMAFILRKQLEREGYELAHAGDGEAALQELAKVKYDAVVLDLMMPKMDGLQMLKKLRTETFNQMVPVIGITAARLKAVEEEALRYGAKLFLDKTQTDQLLAGLRKIMQEVRRPGRELAHGGAGSQTTDRSSPPPDPAATKSLAGTFGRLFRSNGS